MRRLLQLMMLIVAASIVITAGNHWLHIYQNTQSFKSFDLSRVASVKYLRDLDDPDDSIQIELPTDTIEPADSIVISDDGDSMFADDNYDENSVIDDPAQEPEAPYYTKMLIVDDAGNEEYLDLASVDSCVVGSQVPILYITLDDFPEQLDLVDKDTYLNATIRVEGNGYCNDAEHHLQIKGRGNSTWHYDKKPYRLKASKKFSLCGLNKAKSFALIANYLDPTLMENTIAFWIARRLGMPYTNHSVPVMIYFNGDFKGAYMATEKVGINAGSVNIDESTGILFELDSHYDEEYKFMYEWSTRYRKYSIPVMVKDPDLNEVAAELYPNSTATADDLFAAWKADFSDFADAVVSSTSATDLSPYVDLESVANYLLVCCICRNPELAHPKSVYIYKDNADDVYHLGPVWDFDWAFSFSGSGHSWNPNLRMFTGNGDYSGYSFFLRFCQNAAVKKLLGEKLQKFIAEDYDDLMAFIDEYAALIEPSAKLDGVRWPTAATTYGIVAESSFDFRENIASLKDWLEKHINFMINDANYGLY